MNPQIETTKKRSEYLQKIRDFFTTEGFLEVETPIMTPIPGMEPHLNPFETTLTKPNGQKTALYLNTSPELQMKKLLGQGFDNIFNITKVFRNGEIGGNTHNPEFTMLEWYRTGADYTDIMNDTEKLIKSLIPEKNINHQGKTINIHVSWDRVSTQELFLKECSIDLMKNREFTQFKQTAKKLGFDTNGCRDWDDIFFKIFLNHIEPHLGMATPVFVYDYPSTQAALAKKSAKNPFFAERFELYIAGLELANAFSELIDSKEQRQRLTEEQNLRKKLQKTVFDIDEDFLTKLEFISQPTAGIALGVDRLLMLLLNKKSIEEVLLFPMEKMLKTI